MKKPLFVVILLLAAVMAVFAQPAAETHISSVTNISKFGNVDLDIRSEDFLALGYEFGDTFDISFGNGYTLTDIPFFNGWYTKKGEVLLVAYPDTEYLFVAILYGNLADAGKISVGEKCRIRLNTKGGRRDDQLLFSLTYSFDRDDYVSDEVFANFRMVATTGIAPGVLYRSASPVDNQRNRAVYADNLIEKAGVESVINLAESDEEIEKLLSEYSETPYYSGLYENGKVVALGMGLDYASAEFGRKLVSGFVQFVNKGLKPPVDIHCLEGKDRTGFAFALLEALMGASESEIIDDYMITFSNYYNVSKEDTPERYDAIVKRNIAEIISFIKGSQSNIRDGAKAFFLNNGMSPTELDALSGLLSYQSST